MQIDSRKIEGSGVDEYYITARPESGADLESEAHKVLSAVVEELRQRDAHLFCERIFATHEAVETVERVRNDLFIGLADGVRPTVIAVAPGSYGQFAGVQVHAVAGSPTPTAMGCDGRTKGAAGRVLQSNGSAWLYANGLSGHLDQSPAEQARRMLFCAGCYLNQSGGSMRSVARTWLWLKDICDWYDDLNATRNAFFECEGLIGHDNGKTHLPASTGIGMYGANGAACMLDLIAMPGAEDQIQLLEAGGDQESAFEYGSAFSRAAIAPMPAGPTLFISGTAAIDRAGVTEHVGKVEAQIDDTIAHVRALLDQGGCTDQQVLTSLVYCKTPEIEQVFHDRWGDLPWPRLTMVGDVCRPELLFEVEATASPAYAG